MAQEVLLWRAREEDLCSHVGFARGVDSSLMSAWQEFLKKASRRRKVSNSSRLVRCLGFWDLVSFGVGNSLGAGLFVTIGPAAVKYAGPGVALSFLLGAIAALLTALCYAQLATVPGVGSESGSAYMYVCRARFITGGGYRLLASANFGELVLGCINADLCNSM